MAPRLMDDLAQVLRRSRAAGVSRLVVTAGNLKMCRQALELVKDYDDMYVTIGCHPRNAAEFDRFRGGPDAYVETLKAFLQNPANKKKIVAIGECGLDYDRLFFCPKETQLKHFHRHFELAEMTGLPMFLHDRNTGGDFARIITENRKRFNDGIVHSFTGTQEDLKTYIDLGLYISLNGCSLKTEGNLKAAAKVPLDRLLIETDGPWCEIRPTHASFKHLKMTKEQQDLYKPRAANKERFEFGNMVKGRNEPCTIGQVLLVLADLHGMDPEKLAEICYENSLRVYFPEEVAKSD
ncbi:TatD DNase [Mortierella sp. GBA35]|nr:TatD DNase [Mortierella sp. AD031]KAF9098693.1 TatD DNase [Mortierella sp. GBA35]KAG0212430.1 TatD DNase [Mortierella sp. NVP41]